MPVLSDLVFRLSAYHMQYACNASYATDLASKSTDNITLRLVIVSFVYISSLRSGISSQSALVLS